MDEKLSPLEHKQLQDALLSAFPSEGALEQMLYFELGTNLRVIREGANYSQVVFNLIKWGVAEGKIGELINGARRANSGNPALRRFAVEFQARRAVVSRNNGQAGHLTAEIRNSLAQALLKIPTVLSFEGRSALLVGLPWAQSLNRSPTNARVDLDLIIDQLDTLGPLESGTWPLAILIDNAVSYIPNTALGRDLQKIRQELGRIHGAP